MTEKLNTMCLSVKRSRLTLLQAEAGRIGSCADCWKGFQIQSRLGRWALVWDWSVGKYEGMLAAEATAGSCSPALIDTELILVCSDFEDRTVFSEDRHCHTYLAGWFTYLHKSRKNRAFWEYNSRLYYYCYCYYYYHYYYYYYYSYYTNTRLFFMCIFSICKWPYLGQGILLWGPQHKKDTDLLDGV